MKPAVSDVAWDFFEKAINPIPIVHRSKVPPEGFPLREVFEHRMGEDYVRAHFCGDAPMNIGIACGHISGIVVIDADSREAARSLYQRLPSTPAMERTPRGGGHFVFRLDDGVTIPTAVKASVLGVPVDIRSDGSYVVVCPSVGANGKPYEWLTWPWNLADPNVFYVDCRYPAIEAEICRL